MPPELTSIGRWRQLCHALGVATADSEYERLARAWANRGRHYHTTQHLDGTLHARTHAEGLSGVGAYLRDRTFTEMTELDPRPRQHGARFDLAEDAVDEALVRQRVEDWAQAIRAKDIDRVMSLYAPTIVSCDIVPPLRYAGADNKRRAWQDAFATYTGPVTYDVHDMAVTALGELAFVHSLNHVQGRVASGRVADLWLRWTACSGVSTACGSSCTITRQSQPTSSTAKRWCISRRKNIGSHMA